MVLVVLVVVVVQRLAEVDEKKVMQAVWRARVVLAQPLLRAMQAQFQLLIRRRSLGSKSA